MARQAATRRARCTVRTFRFFGLRADGVERALVSALALGYALAALTPCLDTAAVGMRAAAVPEARAVASARLAHPDAHPDSHPDSHRRSGAAHAELHSHDHAALDAQHPHDEGPPEGWCRSGRRPAVWLAVCPCGCDDRSAPGGLQAEKGILAAVVPPIPRWNAARFPDPPAGLSSEAPRAVDTVPIRLSVV